jgi:hypothetical protein
MIRYCCQSTKRIVATVLRIARVQGHCDLLIFLVEFDIF